MKQIFLFLFLASFFFANAQYAKIDSLSSSLIETSSDEIKMEVYLEMSRTYSAIDLDTSVYYGTQSYDLALTNDWGEKQAEILVVIGYTHLNHGDIDKCFRHFERALTVSTQHKDTSSMAMVCNAIGVASWEMNDNEGAIRHFQNAHDLAQQVNNSVAYEASLNNLGMISGSLGRNEKSIQYFEKFVTLSEKSEKWKSVAMGNMNIGVSYEKMEEYEKAIAYYEKALGMKSLLKEQNLVALIYMNVADVHFAQEKYTKALIECNNALAICNEFGYRDLRYDILELKAMALLKLKQFQKALVVSQGALKEIKGSNSAYLIPAFEESLSNAYEGLGNYKKALFWQKKYSTLQDSLHEANRDAAIAEIEISHQTKEKEAENALLKNEKAIQEAALYHRTWVAYISIVGLLMFSIFSFLLYLARKKLKVMNNDLEATVAARTEALERSNGELQQSNEELKRFAFIASHDLKEPLRNTGSFISLMKKRLKDNNFESLKEYMTFVEKSNYQMVDLVDNILAYSQLEGKKAGKKKFVDINEEVKLVSELLQTMMIMKNAVIFCEPLPKVYCNPFLIKVVLKNLIENGIRYNESEQPTIHISAKKTATHLNLIVSDNGIGISEDYKEEIFGMFVRLNSRSMYTGSGMGLAFCKKMLDSNGETITVESEVGKGSTFTVTIHATTVNEDGGTDFSLDEGMLTFPNSSPARH